MYTKRKMQHILLHVFSINFKSYIRIINVKTTEEYLNEYNKIYNNTNKEFIYVFHNQGDIYNRVISDLNYKKFKQFKFANITDTLYEITLNKSDEVINILEIFKNYIKLKLDSYIDDDESEDTSEYFNIPITVEDNKNLVRTYFDQKQIYTLCNIDKTDQNTYAMSKDHLLALIAKYIDYKCIEMRDINYNYKSSDSKLEIKLDKRTIYISSFNLESCDIEKIFETLNISFGILKTIKKKFNISDNDNNLTGLSYGNYAAVDFDTVYKDEFSNSSLFNDYFSEINKCPSIDSWPVHISPIKNKNLEEEEDISKELLPNDISFLTLEQFKNNLNKPKSTKLYIYNNVINNLISIFEYELVYLTEFKLINSISKLSAKLVEFINTNSINLDDIGELKDLIDIIKPVSESNQQYDLTKVYVDKNKNDQKDTLASVVVDNVKSYLSETITNINQNQIGQDLVELGVKKTRKSKGFVYGINDTSASASKIDLANPMPFADKNIYERQPAKTTLKELGIRTTPPNPMIPNVSPFNMSSKI